MSTKMYILCNLSVAVLYKSHNTLLKIFKGTVMFLRCVYWVNFINFTNVLKPLCRAFYQIFYTPVPLNMLSSAPCRRNMIDLDHELIDRFLSEVIL